MYFWSIINLLHILLYHKHLFMICEKMCKKKAKSFIYLDLAFEYKRKKKGPGS